MDALLPPCKRAKRESIRPGPQGPTSSVGPEADVQRKSLWPGPHAPVCDSDDTTTATEEADWFDATQDKMAIADLVAKCNERRHLHLLDLFSASKRAADAWTHQGYSAMACDIRDRHTNYDILSKTRFVSIPLAGLAILPKGFLLAGPPCS